MMNIFSAKSKTKKLKIKEIKDAPTLYVPLQQHIGKIANPVVNVGDRVKRFQLIGEASDYISANVHSPVSGIVKDITLHPLADGKLVQTVIIENDFKNTEIEHADEVDFQSIDPQDILAMIKDAGVVGEGGAQFPTHAKYNIGNRKIKTFIVNGTECEPYLTADYALMKENTSRLLVGIHIVNRILKADEIFICIEHQNKDLVAVFSNLLSKPENSNMKIKILPDKYPQGGELQLIKSCTGQELERNSRPFDFGITVSNVGTIVSVYAAVVHHKPLVERIITVSGDKLDGAGNYLVKIGTPLSYLIEELKIDADQHTRQAVLGGPMMGKPVEDISAPIVKGSSGLLTFAKKEIKRSNCILCGYCADVCPMHLQPLKFAELYRKEKYNELKNYDLKECIECAACEYICPSDVPLIESIKNGKLHLLG